MLSLQKQIALLGRVQWILGGGMLLIVTAFVVFGYRPQSRKVAWLDGQISSCQKELSANRDQDKILASVQADVARLKSRLSEFKRLPQEKELAEFIKDIAQLGQQAQLKNPKIVPTALIQRGDRLREAPIQLSFEGDFVNVFAFLRHMEELQRLTRVPTIQIKGKDKGGQVKVEMTMNLYCAVE